MSNQRETLLNVAGMTCRSCIAHVDHALRDLEGVTGVEVRMNEGKVLVKHDGRSVPVEAMVEALREAGYESAPSA